MFVSKNKKILFFHIPKTAGTSIRQYLFTNCSDGHFFTNLTLNIFIKEYNNNFNYSILQKELKLPPAYKHLTQPECNFIIQKIGLDIDNFHEVVVVRNPYDRLLSYYNFILYKNYDHLEKLLDDIEMNNVDPNLHFRHQLEYVKNPITKNLKIFKYEDFFLCQDFLQSVIGTNKKIPKINVTKNNTMHQLTPKLKERVYKIFEEEFDIFKYSKL